MTNALTTQPTDNFAAAAASSASAIVGERLRFTKGRYLVGKGADEPLPANTTLHALDVQAAWVKFEDGRVVDQRVGYPLASRDDLDDCDPELWPLGIDGEPADPWSNQRYLYLVDPKSGRDFTFITSSWGGRAAVEALARQVANKRAAMPGAVAIVKLEVGYKQSQKYGAVPAPRFAVTGWAGTEPPDQARAKLRRDLDDEIPF